MVDLLWAPSLKLEGGAWKFVLWYCDAFDRARSFRTLLADICGVLRQARSVRLSLPQEVVGEDFVEGTLSWGDALYDVYFEYSLGYLQVSNSSEAAIHALADMLRDQIAWPKGPDVQDEPA